MRAFARGYVSRLIGLALLAAGCAASAPPSQPAATSPPSDVSGTWVGSYRASSGNAGASTLVLTQQGTSVSGSVQSTNVDRSFGSTPQPLRDGQVLGNKLTFSATGQDGSIFRADFAVNGDKIEGWGRHTGRGYDVNVQFTYAKQR